MGSRAAISASERPSARHFIWPSRARIQFLFPLSVLISPLWPRRRIGWARRHAGNVLVENRLWTSARCEANAGSRRSG